MGRGIAVGAVLLWLGTGCVEFSRRAEQEARLSGEHRARMERLEELEARLLRAEALRAEWSELRERHGRVTELACDNAAVHAQALVRHDQKEREKRNRYRERRVAAVTPAQEPAAGQRDAARGGAAEEASAN